MPQLDKFIFFENILLTFFSFFSLYLINNNFILPQIVGSVKFINKKFIFQQNVISSEIAFLGMFQKITSTKLAWPYKLVCYFRVFDNKVSTTQFKLGCLVFSLKKIKKVTNNVK